MSSIRGFLITLLLATTVLTTFVSILKGYQASSDEIQQQMDSKLVDLAKLLSNQHVNGYGSAYAINVGEKLAFQVVDPQKEHSDYSVISEKRIAPLRQEFNEVNFSGYRWRSYAFFNDEKKLWVIVAERLDIRFDMAEDIILKSLMPIVLEIPLAIMLIWFVVGYALKPLYHLSKLLKNKRENDLSPLNVDQPYKEVEQVIQSINSLLKRLNLSFEREKCFASDVAHELRTPLSVLKIDFFNLSQKLGEENQDIKALNLGIDRMDHLVQQILTLYRTTPDQFMAAFAPFDLHSLAQKVIAEQYDRFDEKSQSIELQGSSCELIGDQSALEILLVNLVTNANKYTPNGGIIKVTIFDMVSSIVLQVEDSGSGIPEAQHKRVFERFYRLDGDCHASNELGCGIGLSIVKHIVDLHKASISLQHSHFPTGLMISVEFPKDEYNG